MSSCHAPVSKKQNPVKCTKAVNRQKNIFKVSSQSAPNNGSILRLNGFVSRNLWTKQWKAFDLCLGVTMTTEWKSPRKTKAFSNSRCSRVSLVTCVCVSALWTMARFSGKLFRATNTLLIDTDW